MKKKFILMMFFSMLVFAASANTLLELDSVGVNRGIAFEKKINVKLTAIDGQLVIISDDIIARVEIYSAIGGLLYSVNVNSNDVRIDNLPKSILVVRIGFADKRTSVYKIKNE